MALTLSAAVGFTAPALRAPVASRATCPATMSFKEFLDEFEPDFTLDKPWTSDEISDEAGLKELAMKLNPVVGYWDPLQIGKAPKEFIGWYRHAEIKHGRIAMAGFVGYLFGISGNHFPWNLQQPFGDAVPRDTPVISFGDIAAAGGPADQWDALPSSAKLQILMAVGFLEMVGESSYFLAQDGQQHYVRGGKPGYFPKLKGKMPHPVPLNLWDPLGFSERMSAERKEQALLAEVNNGRWAMLGLMGMICQSKGLIVPGMENIPIPPYAGEIMAPFSAVNSDLPGVAQMIAGRTAQIAREAAYIGVNYPGSSIN